jgi:hypothetical protein
MLGNLNVKQIENRLGIEFPKDVREFMNKTNQSRAERIEKGKWHCFDIPFNLVCGDMDVATKIFESVKDKSSECKEQLKFSLSGGK